VNNLIETENVFEIREQLDSQVFDWCKTTAYHNRVQANENEDTWHIVEDQMYIPDHILDRINDWLSSINFPNLQYAVLFQKRNLNETRNQSLNIDYNEEYDEPSKACVNIAIENFDKTFLHYWKGSYDLQKRYSNDTVDMFVDEYSEENHIPYLHLEWNDQPVVSDTYPVTEKVHVCKIDIPHSVTAFEDYRVMLSLRLDKNPSLQQLKEYYYQGIEHNAS